MAYVFLGLAIVLEVVATTFLKASQGFTVLVPTLAMATGYGMSFYFLGLSLQTIPLGLAYATWAGLGIVLVSLSGYIIYHQQLDLPAIFGISLIIGGVMVIKFFSNVV